MEDDRGSDSKYALFSRTISELAYNGLVRLVSFVNHKVCSEGIRDLID